MSSAKLISAFRAVSQQAQLTCRPANALRTSFRSFSHTPPYRMPSPSQMPDVANTASPIGQPEKSWTGDTDIALRAITSQPLPNPYSGRTVAVTKSLGDSLKALDGILARNKVKYELRSAERHEKKGVKRRRLASERWRNQFANEVRKNVQLVMKMRDRGA
ncbi:hypothetical protein D9756_001593 [Leucocoprinus leucothites]|uniref:Ribosomal protein S21 n=1 Tax=Leucocoprinus leucothites TaxID=201217 RepID=A0A8H5G433_9AGAR|nr:hypothetical protein D9756_001593 [Leucoagaricus leucothites]